MQTEKEVRAAHSPHEMPHRDEEKHKARDDRITALFHDASIISGMDDLEIGKLEVGRLRVNEGPERLGEPRQ